MKPTIARIWRGRTTRARADEYQTYLYEHGIKPLEQKALPRRIHHLPRDAEFLSELPQGVQVLEIVSGNIAVGRAPA